LVDLGVGILLFCFASSAIVGFSYRMANFLDGGYDFLFAEFCFASSAIVGFSYRIASFLDGGYDFLFVE
jgi:hypothetical protein